MSILALFASASLARALHLRFLFFFSLIHYLLVGPIFPTSLWQTLVLVYVRVREEAGGLAPFRSIRPPSIIHWLVLMCLCDSSMCRALIGSVLPPFIASLAIALFPRIFKFSFHVHFIFIFLLIFSFLFLFIISFLILLEFWFLFDGAMELGFYFERKAIERTGHKAPRVLIVEDRTLYISSQKKKRRESHIYFQSILSFFPIPLFKYRMS